MKTSVVAGLLALFAFTQVQAYKEGTYRCKNMDGLPSNVYKVQNVSVGAVGSVPFVEVTRHFKTSSAKSERPYVTAKIQGFAVQASSDAGLDILTVGHINLEFNGETMTNCRPE